MSAHPSTQQYINHIQSSYDLFHNSLLKIERLTIHHQSDSKYHLPTLLIFTHRFNKNTTSLFRKEKVWATKHFKGGRKQKKSNQSNMSPHLKSVSGSPRHPGATHHVRSPPTTPRHGSSSTRSNQPTNMQSPRTPRHHDGRSPRVPGNSTDDDISSSTLMQRACEVNEKRIKHLEQIVAQLTNELSQPSPRKSSKSKSTK